MIATSGAGFASGAAQFTHSILQVPLLNAILPFVHAADVVVELTKATCMLTL